jgi:hypothetical protein
MFHGWDSFYLLIGTAAAALIGLLFVVATLTAGHDATAVSRGTHLYNTPTVFNLAAVLVISALALAPDVPAHVVGLLLALSAAVGFIYSTIIIVEFRRGKTPAPPHWSDIWCYAVAPAALYLALGVIAALIWRRQAWVPYGVAATSVALLLVAIRNAWDLVTWLAPRRD